MQINTHHVNQLAYLINRMKSTPDGDGNLLDYSMILYGSSISDGNKHTHPNLPTALIGGAGGKLKGEPPHSLCRRNADEQFIAFDVG